MAQIDRSNLGYLGEDFQYRLTHEFMANHQFFEDLSSIVDQNMFTDPTLKVIVGTIKNYFERYGNVPSYSSLNDCLSEMSHSTQELETYFAVSDKIKGVQMEGVDHIRELAEKFFRQQNIIRTAHEILNIAGSGDIKKYDSCVSLLNEAITKGVHNDFGEGNAFR